MIHVHAEVARNIKSVVENKTSHAEKFDKLTVKYQGRGGQTPLRKI